MRILFSCIFAPAAIRVTHTPSNNPRIIRGIKYGHKFIQLLLLFYTKNIVYGFHSAVKRKNLKYRCFIDFQLDDYSAKTWSIAIWFHTLKTAPFHIA